MARERKFSTDELFQATKALLLSHGYEGFTFSLLADSLNVSRGALYKYYENKDELITNYIFYEMDQYLLRLKQINLYQGFEAQLQFLLDLMFSYSNIQKLIKIGQQVPGHQDKFKTIHTDMYRFLQDFVELGKKEGKLKCHLPNNLILGYIFQSVAIPNHSEIPYSLWVSSLKEMICHGILSNN
jgi:AcrR family transcriptional regulator